jgi:hypothetical protein
MVRNSWRRPVLAWSSAVALMSGPLLAVCVSAPASAAPVDVQPRPPAARHLTAADSLVLNGVYCTSAANCWAVGNLRTGNATKNQVLHRTAGGKWRRVSVPEPGGTAAGDNNNLNAVRCASPTNCWAVGDYQPLGSARLDQILHWNGTRWSVVSAPAPGGTATGDFNELNDVACSAAASCWAVGYYGIDMTTTTDESVVALTQALHWNGRMWSLVRTPNPGGHSKNHVNALNAVRCASARNCWAAGSDGSGDSFIHRNLMLHWNGAKWATAHVPNPGGTAALAINQIRGLSCTSPTNCWAAGSFGKQLSGGHEKLRNQVMHWSGGKWVKVTLPNPDGTGPRARNDLFAITCTAAGNCWAVGSTGGHNGRPGLNETLHWNATKWSVIRAPEPGGTNGDVANILTGIRCTKPANCWAVGAVEMSTGAADQILHWNGTSWRTTLGPSLVISGGTATAGTSARRLAAR